MLKAIEYSVTFPTTGRSLSESVVFQNGYGVITGPNESGKSFITEMVRWLLFGTGALRGKVTEYEKLTGKLTVGLRGKIYVITRTLSNAKIKCGDEDLATGTRPVNHKIVSLLGFGLDVFDMACIANQGELERLGAMRPADRKRIVDSVIGLGVIEDLAKSVGTEALQLLRRAEDLEGALVAPTPVEVPEGYRPAAEIKVQLDEMATLIAERDRLFGWLSQKRTEPVAPVEAVKESSDELRIRADNYNRVQALLKVQRTNLANLPQPSPYNEDDLALMARQSEAYTLWTEKKRILDSVQQPTLTSEDIATVLVHLADYAIWQRHEAALARIQNIRTAHELSCPACDHKWLPDDSEIVAIQQQIEALPVVPEAHRVAPSVSRDEVEQAKQVLARWNAVQPRLTELRDVVETSAPSLSAAEIEQHRRANTAAASRAALEAEVLELESQLGEGDPNDLYRQRLAYEQGIVLYKTQLDQFNEWKLQAEKNIERVAVLKKTLEDYKGIDELYHTCVRYESDLTRYEAETVKYEQQMAQVSDLKAKSEDWKRAKEGLLLLRTMIKQHIIPSLNKVSSHLIRQMTNGQRSSIVVDEEFNITIDNQSMETLSGSGKAVANLAIRVALGQILTNNVLSLFIGDEIDASMDKDRGESTSQTLQTLKQRISQILLITHKYPVADYYITTGNDHAKALD